MKEDTYSMLTASRLYARAGEWVDIISDRGGPLIVKPKNGSAFPVLVHQLSDEPIGKKVDAAGGAKMPAAQRKTPAIRNSHRTVPAAQAASLPGSGQGALF